MKTYEIHDRMPVVIELTDVAEWLDPSESGAALRVQLMRPASVRTLQHYCVDSAVGSVRNDGPKLIEPVEPQSLF